MARRGVHKPKRVADRYEALVGDLNEQRTLYLLRRHLGVEPEDAAKLPWWKRKLYVEGLLWEFSNEEPTDYIEPTPENLRDLGLTTGSVGGE